jgi:hypothetical protein
MTNLMLKLNAGGLKPRWGAHSESAKARSVIRSLSRHPHRSR